MTPRKYSPAQRLLCALMLSIVTSGVFARTNITTRFSERDYAMYPQYCRARIDRKPQALVDYWTAQLGRKNFLHMHHYCFGLKALNLAYANLRDKSSRGYLANEAVSNFRYVVDSTQPDFYLRPEALFYLGRAHELRLEYDEAREQYQESIRLNPKLANAWVALSDMYYQLGRKSDALYILEEASEKVGENKKIDLRIAEMRAAGIKASAPPKKEE